MSHEVSMSKLMYSKSTLSILSDGFVPNCSVHDFLLVVFAFYSLYIYSSDGLFKLFATHVCDRAYRRGEKIHGNVFVT